MIRRGVRRASMAAAAAVLCSSMVLLAAGPAGAGAPTFVPVGPPGSAPGAPTGGLSPGASVEPGANGLLVFVSDRYATTPNVFTVDPTNPAVVTRLTGCNLTTCPGGAISPAWSPDGRQIAFVRDADGEGSGPIYTMYASGGHQVQVGALVGGSPTWSPDASKLAFSAVAGEGTDIFIATSDGSGSPIDITNDPETPDLQPAWSPDGTKVTYVANGQGGTTDVFVINADGTGSPTNITSSAAADQHPAWSPDGKKIAFDDGTGISWIRADGSGSAEQVVADGVMPSWSGDGNLIAFSTARDGNLEVYTTTVDGLTQTRMTNAAASDTLPVWQSIQVTIAVSPNVVHFRENVTVTAHLNLYQQTTNPTLTIKKTPFGGQTYTVISAPVDANGDLIKTLQVYSKTTFVAYWDGDPPMPPSQTRQVAAQVQSVTSGALSGYYGSNGDYRLYHYTDECVGPQHNGCPVYTVRVVPDGTGLPVAFTLQQLVNASWKTIATFSYPLGTGSKIAVKLTYGNRGVIGHSFRIMAAFKGNGSSLPSASNWSYFRITN